MGGCVAFFGAVAKHVVDDPGFKKATQQLSDMGKNMAAQEVEAVPGSTKISHDSMGLMHVKGKIHNKTDKTLPYLQVKMSGNDKDGSHVDEAMTNTSSLGPHETWAYDLIFTKKGVAKPGTLRISTTMLDDK